MEINAEVPLNFQTPLVLIKITKTPDQNRFSVHPLNESKRYMCFENDKPLLFVATVARQHQPLCFDVVDLLPLSLSQQSGSRVLVFHSSTCPNSSIFVKLKNLSNRQTNEYLQEGNLALKYEKSEFKNPVNQNHLSPEPPFPSVRVNGFKRQNSPLVL